MRYQAEEKLEIIRLVEQSNIPAKQALDRLGIPRTTFYRWYDKYQRGGAEALEDNAPMPARVWNRIPLTLELMTLPVLMWIFIPIRLCVNLLSNSWMMACLARSQSD